MAKPRSTPTVKRRPPGLTKALRATEKVLNQQQKRRDQRRKGGGR